MKHELQQFTRLLENCTSFVLTTHISPDCDGLGSEMALGEFLTARGKRVTILNHSETPPPYRFLDPNGTIHRYHGDRHNSLLQGADVIVVLDTNQPDRLGSMADAVLASPAKKVVIDHHLEAHPFADLYLLDETAAATGEILCEVLTSFGQGAISRRTAHALYTAIMTDTGSFRFPKTDAKLHRIVAELIDLGADPVLAYQQVYEQDSPNRLRLLGMALSSISTAHDGKVAYLTITADMFSETGTNEADVERFAPYTLTLQGVQIGLMFTDLGDQIKISFRSKGDIPINKLAQEFGGNGHKNAAGARVPAGDIHTVMKNVVSSAGKYLSP
ncbi:MAG: DHH family phosphoesterase [Bacteroidia bacterium]|nr:MAG: DHH family phosphoesterase [Bacteroidia bacterium]